MNKTINISSFFFVRFDFLTRNRLHFQRTSFTFCRHILRPDLLIIQYVEFTTLLGQPINQLIEKKKSMLVRIIKMRFVLLTNVVIIYLIIS